MERYHDKEWGVPLFNDREIFEFLVLESAQAGLSWLIVLRKRGGYKKAFASFDFKKVARFTARDVARLVKNPDIIRNRAKIEAAVNNAKRFLEIRKEFGTFSNYAWQFVDNKPIVKDRKSMSDLPAKTNEAELWAKDLKKRGFKFLGATVMYAHMQATGMVNDHVINCFRFKEVARK
ncbi:MAG: DNA-3-methyladenine glycosylase I [Patescibacteria group bacterium]